MGGSRGGGGGCGGVGEVVVRSVRFVEAWRSFWVRLPGGKLLEGPDWLVPIC